MSSAPDFTESPILNTPYDAPAQHWELDDNEQPTRNILAGRRNSAYFIPIPAARQARQRQQNELGINPDANEKRSNEKVNTIREKVEAWRALPPSKQKVSYVTQRLLAHWRDDTAKLRPFYCQVEAAETPTR